MASAKGPMGKRSHPQTPGEILIDRKARVFVQAERQYWRARWPLQRGFSQLRLALSEDPGTVPSSISSTVWGLRDGVAFVRYASPGPEGTTVFRIWDVPLETWVREGPIVPVNGRDFFLAREGGPTGYGHGILVNCTVGKVHLPYVEFSSMKYGEPGNTTAIENAIYDFQIFLLGLQVRGGFLHAPVVPETQPQDVVRRLSETADRFQELLATADREEDLQAFIKDHPMLLDEASDRIPKQKLGEDFVTDFVIVRQTAQGHVYTLVEIEKASQAVVNKDGYLTAAVSHAIAQTRSWDIWLEKNKNYLQ